MSVVEVRGLTYSYPRSGEPALRGLDLRVEEGEFVVLAGPSGGGKSTLLRAICGLVPHFHGGTVKGRVRLKGKDTRDHDPASLFGTYGMVFQDPETQMVMTNAGNDIAFGLRNLGWDERRVAGRVREVARLTGVSHLLDRFVPSLSGGERQRLAIASAMAPGPKVLLLDEPTSQLDPAASRDILGLVGRLHQEEGVTVVMAEHRLERCLDSADRFVVMEAGAVVHDGRPSGWLAGAVAGQWKGAPPAGGRRRRKGGGKPVVRCEGVSFAYNGGAKVLDDVSLDVRPGEILAIMGPNGAGKTTLARMLNGLHRPDAGTVSLRGRDISRMTTAELSSSVGFLAQDVGGYLTRETVADELDYTLELQKVPAGEREKRVRRTLADTGTDRWAGRDPRSLSCGGRHLAALASVLAARPRVLVLDEPTRGIDPELKGKLEDTLGRLAQNGTAVVLVTQDPGFARRVAHRRLVLKDGRIRDSRKVGAGEGAGLTGPNGGVSVAA